MPGKKLLIIGSTLGATEQETVVSTLARWPLDQRPDIKQLSVSDYLGKPPRSRSVGAAWIALDVEPNSAVYELIALLQDAHIPAIITRPGETLATGATYQTGVLVAPPGAPAGELCAALRALWGQADLLGDLRMQLEIATAHQGGLCDQIDKMDEELRMAAQLQRDFLPHELPKLAGVEARVLYRPASYVSGDIFDVERLDEDHLGLFVADAVGHGVPAALLTVSIKRSLRTKEINRAYAGNYRLIPPDEALGHLNLDLVELQTGRIRTATAAYGVLNARTLELEFARAGHPFPLILHRDGTTTALDSDGAMLGVFPEERFELLRVKLEPDDRLLFFSDGFELAFRDLVAEEAGKPLANTNYLEEFASLAEGTLDQAIRKFERRLDQQAGSLNQLDDLTALLVGMVRETDADQNETWTKKSTSDAA